ncbi:MAG: hypothetical protein JWR38_5432 [Mucilaginibacter sp.]|nr:hypothetical protein [Mucilaginibacter sp.]
MSMKRIIGIIGTLMLVSLFVYFNSDNWAYKSRIYKNEIHSIVTKIVPVKARFKVFYADRSDTGFRFNINEDISFGYNDFFYTSTFNITDEIYIGDSLSKPAGSLLLSVYRKSNDGKYAFYKAFKGVR